MISRLAYVRLARCLAAASLLLPMPGCAHFNPRGDGFSDGTAHWADGFRRSTPEQKVYGFSTRAQEIERNLGVR